MSIVAWKVNSYDRTPTRKEFVRETNAFYIGVDRYDRERKEKKESSWWRYFTDEQEALSFIAARDAAKEKRASEDRAERLLIAAAPELLEALQDALPLMGWSNMSDAEIQHEADEGNGTAPVIQKMRAAIAKATGGQ